MTNPGDSKPRPRQDRPEVLAPGGSTDAIIAAVQAGADAVYVGVGPLNARTRAANLTQDQLPAVVRYAHSAGAAIHVALNVPVTRSTLADAAETLAAAWLSGADAVIVRDPILMRLAAQHFPGMALHASTQFGVLGPAGAHRARDLGCTRLILARELSLDEIRRIRKAVPDIELESFFFGALCFGISGQCLLGEAVARRSGNYGNCAQACRLEYFTQDGTPLGRIFSMKDLDLFPRIRELVDAGIWSLKIEGRMKSPAWVRCVTSWARRASGKWRSGGLSKSELAEFRRDVALLFSRPRTSGFLDGTTDAADLTCPSLSGQAGLPVERFVLTRTATRSGGKGHAVRFAAPVDLAVYDGLQVTTGRTAPGLTEVFSIQELTDGQGRAAKRIAAGQEAVVVLPLDLPPLTLAIHSANSAAARYAASASGELSDPTFDEGIPRPQATRFVIQDGRLVLAGRIGRFQAELDFPVEVQPARNEGLTPALVHRYFPQAECEMPAGLYVNPSELKARRREFADAMRGRYAQRLKLLAESLLASLDPEALPFQPEDQILLARGPACVSRVTGLPAGEVRTSGGDRFRIEPAPRGTLVRHIRRSGI